MTGGAERPRAATRAALRGPLLAALVAVACSGPTLPRPGPPEVAPEPVTEGADAAPAPVAAEPTLERPYAIVGTATRDGGETLWCSLTRRRCEPLIDGFVAVAMSPSARIFAGIGAGRAAEVRSLSGETLRELTNVECLPAFVDEDRLLSCRRSRDDSPARDAIVEVTISSGAERVVFQTDLGIWDDIPLRLSPDGRHLGVGLERRLHLVDLDAGTSQAVTPLTHVIWWEPGGDRFLAAVVEEPGELFLGGTAQGGPPTLLSLGSGSILGAWLGRSTVAVARTGSEPRQGRLFVRDLDSGAERAVADGVWLDDEALYGWAAGFAGGQGILFVGAAPENKVDLRLADLGADPPTVETIAGGVGRFAIVLGVVE